jgi:hypothetical protein
MKLRRQNAAQVSTKQPMTANKKQLNTDPKIFPTASKISMTPLPILAY